MTDQWQGVCRDEYDCGRLLDQDDIAAMHTARDDWQPYNTRAEMISAWADHRRAVERFYDGRRWGWWDQDEEGNVTIVGGGADDVDYYPR